MPEHKNVKVSIIGASGDVGREVFKSIVDCVNIREIVLIYHSSFGWRKLVGMASDELIGNRDNAVTITNKLDSICGSDIVIMCAGAPVSQEVTALSISGNNNDNNRDALYETNMPIINDYMKAVREYSQNALVIMVTNPVSKLIRQASFEYPKVTIVGCGVTNDTLRLRNEFNKVYPSISTNALFVIGEHSISAQCVALSHFNHLSGASLSRDVFEYIFTDEKAKKAYIAFLKNKQNNMIRIGNISRNEYSDMPLLYRSYFTHRLAHFLYKTHMSTALAVKEIVFAYIFEDRLVCVETILTEAKCVVGMPIMFLNGRIIHEEIFLSPYEKSVVYPDILEGGQCGNQM